MCGIIGVLGKLPTKNSFLAARDTMALRGPDDFGDYYCKEEKIALGQRRLSILDLSIAGHQPFYSVDRRYSMVFNGEIYNYLEIKKELSDGYNFQTRTDTEVLLAAYLKWGAKCLSKLNGMFAFAIWDRKEKKLFLARDQFGIKPLFYSEKNGTIYFSSEVKGILHFKEIPRKLNRKGLLDYLSYRYVLGGETLFEGIYSILPGHYLVVKKGKMSKQICYWKLPVVLKKKDFGEKQIIKKTDELLREAVHLRLRSDVPVGAYLSGGLDSSVVVAMMAEMSDKKIKTFSIGFSEDGFSELEYAKIVSKKFHTEHQEFTMPGEEYFNLLPKVIEFKDAPLLSPNEVAWYFLSKKLNKDITVVFAGGGADELFGGYGRIFRSGFDLERMIGENNLSSNEKKILIGNLLKKYNRLDYKSALEHFLSQYPYLGESLKKNLVDNKIFGKQKNDILNRSYFRNVFRNLKQLSYSDQYLNIFQTVHLLGTLESLDAVSMGASVEARVPYVDKELIEYVSALPLKYKLAWRSKSYHNKSKLLNSDQISEVCDIPKYLLKEIGKKYLPTEIMNRKKMGFPVPLEKWFTGKFEEMAKKLLLSSQSKSAGLYDKKVLTDLLNHKSEMRVVNHGLHIWMLVNIELWFRKYNVAI